MIKNANKNKTTVFIDSISDREFSKDDLFFYIKKEHGYCFMYTYLNDRNTKIVYDKFFLMKNRFMTFMIT